MKAISDTQLEVLCSLEQGDKIYYQKYMGNFNPRAYWFISKSLRELNSFKRVRNSTVRKLIERGLIEHKKSSPFDSGYGVITSCGLKYLEHLRNVGCLPKKK